MSKLIEDIDAIFKKHINEMQEIPDTNVWENISFQLRKDANKKYKIKFIYWRNTTAIITVLYLLSLLTITINSSKHVSKPALIKFHSGYVLNTSPKSIKDSIAQLELKFRKESDTAYFFRKYAVNLVPFAHYNKYTRKNKYYDIQQKNMPNKKKIVLPISASISYHNNTYRSINSTAILNANIIDNKFHTTPHFTAEEDTALLIHTNLHITDFKSILMNYPEATVISAGPKDIIKKKQLKQPYISIAPILGPYFMNYFHRSPQNANQTGNEHQAENNELSYSIGLFLKYYNKHWQFSTGLQYSKSFVSIQPKTIYATQNPYGIIQYKYSTTTGYAFVTPTFSNQPQIGDSLYTTTAKHTLQYLSIPLRIGYQLNSNKWSVIPTIGITMNLLENATIETGLNNGSQSEQEVITGLQGLKKMYFSFFTGISIEYKLHPGISVFITPNMQIGLQSTTKKNMPSTIPYQVGIEAGTAISF